MKIYVWHTSHEIATNVAHAVTHGLYGAVEHKLCDAGLVSALPKDVLHNSLNEADIHIGYGILRGMDEVFRACDEIGKPWFNIDKGYWKPGHYDGYYRVSSRGTQQTFGFDQVKPDYDRWDRLRIEIEAARDSRECSLVCPPTEEVRKFFNLKNWEIMNAGNTINWKFRRKGCGRPLQYDLDTSLEVHTFNSSVGWEALRQGIPVISDPDHSLLGAYVKQFDKTHPISFAKSFATDLNVRRDLFALMAGLQLTLDEMRKGQLWPLLSKLLFISDMTDAKPLQAK